MLGRWVEGERRWMDVSGSEQRGLEVEWKVGKGEEARLM